MDVALFIASWKEVLKGLGVRGKGAKKFSRAGGRRMTGSAEDSLSPRWTLHSPLFIKKGRGSGGGVVPGSGRAGAWRMTGSA